MLILFYSKYNGFSFREEFQFVKYLEQEVPDLQHGFNTKTKLMRFCNSTPDAIRYKSRTSNKLNFFALFLFFFFFSYEKKTLWYYHGVSCMQNIHSHNLTNTVFQPYQCVVHGDLFRGVTCPNMNANDTPLSKNPWGDVYIDIYEKFENLKKSILKEYPGVIEHIQVVWSCDFQRQCSTDLAKFVQNLPLPPKYRLVPRDAVRGC